MDNRKVAQKMMKQNTDLIENLIENSKLYQLGEQLGQEADEKWREYTEVNEKIIKIQEEYQKEIKDLKIHKSRLEAQIGHLEKRFASLFSDTHEKMADLTLDGFIASKMLHAAAQWEAEEAKNQREELLAKMDSLSIQDKSPEELIDYLCQTIQLVRPTYSKNTILNIAICFTQGFLTVFFGEPGCGKTSICHIFGEVLGLNQMAKYLDSSEEEADCVKRYVPVSVEKGWTSKRDFVGYFNPLSKTFDKSNRRIYEALYQLDREKKQGNSRFPYLILLDEANLSPMEYYWSDFMKLCDESNTHCQVNLGEDFVFGIPETLRFFATLNHDHTTETLSPRLVDRAWIISLPYQDDFPEQNALEQIPLKEIQLISWETLRQAFFPANEECVLSTCSQKVYAMILAKLKEKRFFVSPRIHKAIKRYWATASKWFEDETGHAEIVALDYAIAQRILPKITGHGEKFKRWLEELEALCREYQLEKCEEMLKNMMACGEYQQMQYYHFFCSGGMK
ncbi:MAG: hypothetical protein IKM28_01000 [Lachnospiraceae bacterium]|nr:hypothetical protein [Lachnospiraceae bacterium]